MSTPNYNPDDVRKVAQAVLTTDPVLVECRHDFYQCQFCGGKEHVSYEDGLMRPLKGEFPHNPGCAVLTARGLLT